MRAPKGAGGACRRNRRREATRRAEWVRPYRRAQRALDASARLILSTMDTVLSSEDSAKRRPLRTAQRLNHAVRRMVVASLRLTDARRELAAAGECPAELRDLAARRCAAVAEHIHTAVSDVVVVQMDVLVGLATGELVAEHPSDTRPRIVLKPRPVAVRAFLAARQPRVSDRIAPVLRRRRRTPRPAAIRVPRRSTLGRAPPFPSTCLL